MLFVIELLGSLLLMYLLISLAMKSSYTKTEKIMRKGNLTLRHSTCLLGKCFVEFSIGFLKAGGIKSITED